MSGFGLRSQRILCIALVIVFLTTFPALADGCGKATAMTFSETWRGMLTGGDEQWLRLPYRAEVPVVIALEVSKPLTGRDGAGEPLLTVCDLTKNGGADVLQRSPTRQVLLVHSPGDVSFRVTSQDPLRPAGPVKVTAVSAAGGLVAKDIEEMEPEPESPLVCPIEDDHADTMACATPLAVPGTAAGEIGNAWGDDADVFRLELGEDQTVVIQSQGVTDTVGGLFNEQGQLLEMDDDGGEGANFRLVKALVSGLYFVRVEGSQGTEGPYSLTAETQSW